MSVCVAYKIVQNVHDLLCTGSVQRQHTGGTPVIEILKIVQKFLKIITFHKVYVIRHELLIKDYCLTQRRNRCNHLVHMHQFIRNGLFCSIYWRLHLPHLNP